MKTVVEYMAVGQKPKPGDEFLVDGVPVVAVPDAVVGCLGCVAYRHGIKKFRCGELPSCSGITFLPKSEFESDEFKVRWVKFRMGVLEHDE